MDIKLFIDILEAIMIVMFGFSWPFNLIKSIKTKSTKGKSLLFLILIDVGYIAGIVGKIVAGNNGLFDWSTRWWIFAFYILNFIMVSADLVLYFINKNREKALLINDKQ